MIVFTIITDTPARLRNQLIAHGILKDEPGIVPAREGFEMVEIPSPVAGTRAASVKLIRDAEADEIEGEVQDDRLIWQRTKLGKLILNNSVADTLNTIDGRTIRSRRVGTTLWLIREDDAATFHVWL